LVLGEPHIGGQLEYRLEAALGALQLRDRQGAIDGDYW